MGLADDVGRAIALLGGPDTDPVVDLLADPGAGARALDALADHGGLVLRASPELGAAAPGYAPLPVDPVWVRVMRGAREVGTATFRGGDGMVRRAERVDLTEQEEPCCDAPGCDRTRVHAEAWLVLEGMGKDAGSERLLVAEDRSWAGEGSAARTVAALLAGVLGVPAERGGETLDPPGEAGAAALPDPILEGAGVADLARLSVRTEGDRVVLRDWGSRGPRETAGRNGAIGVALMLGAAAAWLGLWRAIAASGSQGAMIACGVLGALLTLAGYAFLGVARFSARYGASSAPLAAVGRDRIVVLPWVGRSGAVDVRPEGRLGAAIPLHEVRAAHPKARGDGVAVELDTDHGPIDVVVCAEEAGAKLWCGALNRAIEEARHPRQGATARQRARQRQAAATA
jgi:hypothetical protein